MPPFQPGQSGNPSGRPGKVTYPGDWLHIMAEWSESDVRAVLDDIDAPLSKRSAARQLLQSVSAKAVGDKAVRPRDIGDATDRIMDRTEGKPVHKQQIVMHDNRDIQTRLNDLVAKVRRTLANGAAQADADHEGRPRLLEGGGDASESVGDPEAA
ncbi:MAG: hypothetical protein CMJ49_04170 [Planctomycetaceae bacterium]|nr:hypothetical protein [Planctomycetaceae bacterium]